MIPGPDTRLHGTSVATVLDGILKGVPVPVEENWQDSTAQEGTAAVDPVSNGDVQVSESADPLQAAVLAPAADGPAAESS